MPLITIYTGENQTEIADQTLFEAVHTELRQEFPDCGRTFLLRRESVSAGSFALMAPGKQKKAPAPEEKAAQTWPPVVQVLMSQRNTTLFAGQLCRSLARGLAKALNCPTSAVTVLIQRIEAGCFLHSDEII